MKRAGWALATLAVVAVAAVAIGVRLIDTPAVRAEIQTRLSAALGGQIEWQSLELRVLPAPHGALRRVRIEIPGSLSARAEDVDVYLRLWPLLRGRAEIAAVTVSRPEVRIAAGSGGQDGGATDPVALYRGAVAPIAAALRKFAPDTVLTIRQAALDIASSPVRLSDLNVAAHSAAESLELEIDTASNFWRRLRLEARVAYADLSARATLRVDELALHQDLPAATLLAQLRTDAKTAIECDLEAALGSLLPEARAKLSLPAGGKPAEVDARLSRIDLAQAAALARRNLSGLQAIESVEGRLSANVRLSLGEQWRANVDVFESDASAKLAKLPWKLSVHAAQMAASEKQIDVRGVRGALGGSAFSDVAARIELGKQPRLSAASGRATLQLEQWFPWLRQQVPQLEEIAALSGGAEVALHRLALRFDRPAAADFDATVTPRQVSATLKSLPAPAAISGGSVRVGPSLVQLDKVALAMLDAKTVVSGTLAVKGPRLELALADGSLGEKTVQWALARAEVPARFEPRTPLLFAAKRIAWAPGAPLEAEASIDFDGGPSLATALAWQPDKLDLRRLAIKDARSDAVLGASLGGALMQLSFSGALYGQSIAAMLRQPFGGSRVDLGVVRGKLLVKGDRKMPDLSFADGRLQVEALDFTPLAGAKVLLRSGDFSADGESLRFTDARLEWEEQAVSLNGVLRRTPKGAVIDAKLDSPGIVVDRLLPAETAKGAAATAAAATGEAKQSMLAKLWQVPLPGRVEVRAGFVQYKHYKIAPLEGELVLERERATLQVKEARMCGLSFPLNAEATADAVTLSTQITMKGEPMAQTMRCVTGEAVDISGTADLRADLRTQGKPAELLQNLSGTAQGEVRKGRIKQFALVGNILSVLSLRNLVSRDATLREDGFPYRSLSAKGEFRNGEFLLEEGFLDSDAARIGASGRIDLQGANSRLDVLVGVLNSVDRVAGALPIIGDIFGSTMLALPISVSGDIRDPRVVPLGPRAVTDRLLGIFERTLKLPGKLVVPAQQDPAKKEP